MPGDPAPNPVARPQMLVVRVTMAWLRRASRRPERCDLADGGELLAGGAAVSVLARQHGLGPNGGGSWRAGPIAARDAAPVSRACCCAAAAPGTRRCLCRPGHERRAMRPGVGQRGGGGAGCRATPCCWARWALPNTSVASVAAGASWRAAACRGDGGHRADAAGVERKRAVRSRRWIATPVPPALDALALGGYEVARWWARCCRQRRSGAIVVDGFITSAAVLVVSRIAPQVLQRCGLPIARANGASPMLAQMQAEPLLDPGLAPARGRARRWPGCCSLPSRAARDGEF